MKLRMASFAAARGRVACVFFIGDSLMDWRISDRASQSVEKARTWMEQVFAELHPEILLTEDTRFSEKKSEHVKSIIDAVSRLGEDHQLLNPRIRRQHDYANKYEEADVIAERYPELKPWLSGWRRFFENEPRNTVLFEAVSYALYILRDPSSRLGAAMG